MFQLNTQSYLFLVSDNIISGKDECNHLEYDPGFLNFSIPAPSRKNGKVLS